MSTASHRITGSLRVEPRAKGRVWVAAYVPASGSKTRKTLGLAWVKDTGRKTPRGAVVWRAADGPKPDERYLTPREALEALLVAERAKPRSAAATAGKTFGEAAGEWLAHSEHVRGVAPTTLASYRVMVRLLHREGWPANLPLRRIGTSKVEAYQDDLLKEGRLGRDSVRRRMIVLRGILGRARQLGWIGSNPASDVKVVVQPPPDPDFNVLEPAEVEHVAASVATVIETEYPFMRNGVVDQRGLAVMRERRELYADAVRLAAYTGLRIGELRALRWRDVDLSGCNLHVRRSAPTSAPAGAGLKAPKSGRGRSVPLIEQASAVLCRLQSAGYPTGPDELVLPTRSGGMLDANRLRDAFYRGIEAAGLGHLRGGRNPMTFHDLRHTFGTLAVRQLPVTDVQAYMGHADIQTTMRYVHHRPRTDAARRLSAAFAEGSSPSASREQAVPENVPA